MAKISFNKATINTTKIILTFETVFKNSFLFTFLEHYQYFDGFILKSIIANDKSYGKLSIERGCEGICCVCGKRFPKKQTKLLFRG